MTANILAIDFDGVIHDHKKGTSMTVIAGKPIDGAFESMQNLFGAGFVIVVHSARAGHPGGQQLIERWIKTWQISTGTKFDFTVTDRKPEALAYIDNRAIRFTRWGDIEDYFA